MFKKILACLLLVSVLAVGLIACAKDEVETPPSNTNDTSDTVGQPSDSTPQEGEDTQDTGTAGGQTPADTTPQAPNEIFDPAEGEDNWINDEHWTPGNY